MCGQDILDQGAGTTDFFKNYVHINWDGTETQNDKPTTSVTGVTGNPVTNGIATVPLDHSVLGAAFEDRITPDRAGHGRLHRRDGPGRRSHRRLGRLQGRLPRLPVRGVRNGGPEGRPDDARVHVLQRPVGLIHRT